MQEKTLLCFECPHHHMNWRINDNWSLTYFNRSFSRHTSWRLTCPYSDGSSDTLRAFSMTCLSDTILTIVPGIFTDGWFVMICHMFCNCDMLSGIYCGSSRASNLICLTFFWHAWHAFKHVIYIYIWRAMSKHVFWPMFFIHSDVLLGIGSERIVPQNYLDCMSDVYSTSYTCSDMCFVMLSDTCFGMFPGMNNVLVHRNFKKIIYDRRCLHI